MTFSNFFLGFSSALALLFAVGEFSSVRLSSKNWYLGGVFLFLFSFLLQSFLWASGLLRVYPHLLHTHVPTTLLIGFFLERYLLLMWENQAEKFNWFLLKCSLAMGVAILSLPLYLMSASEKLKYIEECYQAGTPSRSKIVIFLTIGILFFSFLNLLMRFIKLFRSSTFYSSKTLQLILSILIIGFITILIGGVFAFYGSYIGMETNGYIIGCFLILLYILRLRNPEIFQEVQKIVEEEKKYKNSQLKSLDLNSVANKLTTLLEKEKIYREDNLNLTELASRIGISNHQLSEYLNQELKVSFFQLIHRYRIEEAKERLLSHSDETVLSIAYHVGYQSKSSFNDIFKKETGLTPIEFRKKTKK